MDYAKYESMMLVIMHDDMMAAIHGYEAAIEGTVFYLLAFIFGALEHYYFGLGVHVLWGGQFCFIS